MMVEKKSASRIVFVIINTTLLALFCFVCIVPFWHVIMASFSDPLALMNGPSLVFWIQGKGSLEGYKIVLASTRLWRTYLNTFLYVGATAVLGVFITAIAGYLLSRKEFKLRKFLTMFIMFTMVFNGGTIPTYIIVRSLGLTNTPLAIILPSLTSAYFCIMAKAAFESLPESFTEAAELDGAHPMVILFKILFPLVMPTMAVIAMFLIVMQWNNWYSSYMYLPRAEEWWSLQMYMREVTIKNNMSAIIQSGGTVESALNATLVKYCVVIVGTLPVLAIYPFMQRYFVTGMALGGVKE